MDNNKLDKTEKIRKNKDFFFIYSNGNFDKSKYYSCKYLKNKLNRSRIGIVVKKRFGNSVKRSYEKRIIKEIFRTNKYKLISNYDLIIFLRNSNGTFLKKKLDLLNLLSNIQNEVYK